MDNRIQYLGGNTACKSLGGKPFLPRSDFDFKIMQIEDTRISQTNEIKEMYDGCKAKHWFPVMKSNDLTRILEYGNKSNEIAKDLQDILPHWNIENDGYEFQQCWVIDFKKKKAYDKECKLMKSCISCIWPKKPEIRLRGLCPNSMIEDHYTSVTGFNHHGVIGKSMSSY